MNLIIIISSLILFVTTTSKANEDNVEIHLADNLKRLTKNVLPKPGVFSKKSSTSQRLNYNSKLFQNSVTKHSTRTIEKLKNRLAQERSLHLLQHAKNPVEWYLWGEEAFEKARKEKKLIFVSVGYYICQGCHLMEEESFNNPDIAAVMNEHCVNIKVDGDERPDVLKAYIKTVDEIPSVLGNWPLNLFLTPDLKPVLSGSYYPPADENGRPGFKSILMDLEKKWKSDPESMIQKSSELLITVRKRYPTNFNIPHSNKSIVMKPNPKTTWKRAFTHLERVYDLIWGGFYLAPKYPMVPVLGFLFYSSTKILSPKSKGSLGMALATLQKIDRGGIHDHVGQGFARYSRDIFWHVPHFEKRLSDQAQLAVSFTNAYLITKENHYADVVHDILHYVSRDLSHQDGGFYTAEDADSLPTAKSTKKKTGAYYTWTYEEVNSLLNKPLRFAPTITLSKLFCYHFSIIPTGNVPISSDPQEEFLDQNILIEYRSKEDTAKKFGLSLKAVKYELEKGKNILFEARNKRPRPLLDNKIITSLNGLMISAYAKAASALYIEEYKERAVQAAMFIKKHAWNPRTNTLLRLCYVDKNGAIVNKEQPIEGFLNDYAFLINGLFDLYECTLDSDLLRWIDQLQQRQNELFWDELTYAYYFSSDRDPRILLKFKGDHDGSMPTGNSVATLNLLKMAMITEKASWETDLSNLFQSYVGRFFNNPSSIPTMVTSLNLRYDNMLAVFITGKKGDTQFESLVQVIRDRYSPTLFLIYAENTSVSKLARSLSKSEKGRAAAYLCKNLICNSRIRDPNKLTNLLDAMRR